MSVKKRGRLHYFNVLLEIEGAQLLRLRVIATDCLEAMRIAEDLHYNTKNAKRITARSAVQVLDPLFQPLETVN